MHRLFDEFIHPLLNASRPRSLLEIGVLHGKNTLNLLRWCAGNGAHLTSLDPVEWTGDLPDEFRRGDSNYKYKRGQPRFEDWKIRPEGLEEAFREGLDRYWTCKKKRSLDYFVSPEVDSFDAYVIDGDHNFFTVITELFMIHRFVRKGTAIFLHDVAKTTNARRDEYYDPTLIPDHQIDGPQQGILTAIEVFLSKIGGRGLGRRFFAPYEFHILTKKHDGLGFLIHR